MAVKVEILRDQITLFDDEGEELVAWSSNEWHEDPTVVLSIANAIRMLYEEGGDSIRMKLDSVR